MANKTIAGTHFNHVVANILGYDPRGSLEIDWTTGGQTGGSCYDDDSNLYAVESEPEPEFEDLDKLLESLCPQITFLQYKRLTKEVVVRESKTEREYYGNYYEKSLKKVDLNKLEKFLVEEGLWK